MSTEKRTITLNNEFHNTEIKLLAKIDARGDMWLSKGQVSKARRTLCGVGGCTCGDAAGCRPQMVEEQQDGGARVLDAVEII